MSLTATVNIGNGANSSDGARKIVVSAAESGNAADVTFTLEADDTRPEASTMLSTRNYLTGVSMKLAVLRWAADNGGGYFE